MKLNEATVAAEAAGFTETYRIEPRYYRLCPTCFALVNVHHAIDHLATHPTAPERDPKEHG